MIDVDEITGWNSLPRTYQTYFDTLSNERNLVGRDGIEQAMPYLLSPEKIMPEIDSMIESLYAFSVTPETAKNPKVVEAWKLLKTFRENNERFLIRNNLAVFVYGSMIYDDPRNLDYDIKVVGYEDDPNLSHIVNLWAYQLDEPWRKVGTPQGNFGYRSIESLERHLKAFNDGDISYIDHNCELIEGILSETSIMLTGYPLFMPSPEVYSGLKERISKLASASPLLGYDILQELKATLAIRVERRAHQT